MAGYGELSGGTFRTSYTKKQGPSSSVYGAKGGAMSALSGGISGAIAGAEVGGAIGAVIGGAIGAIGGVVFGFKSGAAKARARRYQRLAEKVQQQREANKDYNTFLQLIRQQRIARASTLSQSVATGTEMSSKTAGAISGQQSQTAYGVQYLAEDRRLQTLYANYMKRAGKAASIAADWSAGLGLLNSSMQFIGTTASLIKANNTPDLTEEPVYDNTVMNTFTMNPVYINQP